MNALPTLDLRYATRGFQVLPIPNTRVPETRFGGSPMQSWPVSTLGGAPFCFLGLHMRDVLRVTVFARKPKQRADWQRLRTDGLLCDFDLAQLKVRPNATLVLLGTEDPMPEETDDVVYARVNLLLDDPLSDPPGARPAAPTRPKVTVSNATFVAPANGKVTPVNAPAPTAHTTHDPPAGGFCDDLLVSLAAIEARPTSWIIKDLLPAGKLTLIAGEPGVSKSMLTTAFAAAVSSGRPWGADGITPVSGDVVIVSPEDDASETLKPRLIAAGGREDRIHVVSTQRGVLELGAILEAADALPNLKLLILDPITGCLSGKDLNRADAIRALLMPVASWAEKRGVGVILVTHLNKTSGRLPLGRILGSQAFSAVARAVFLVCQDPLNNRQRLLLPVKDNIGITQQPQVFRIEDVTLPGGIATARIVFEATRPELTARDALSMLQRPSQASSALEEAMTLLRSFLASGEQSMTAVRDAALAHGISPASLRRAREALAIKPRKNGTRGGWVWGLPMPSTGREKPGLHEPTVSKVSTAAEDAHAHGVSTFDSDEQLRHGGQPLEETFP